MCIKNRKAKSKIFWRKFIHTSSLALILAQKATSDGRTNWCCLGYFNIFFLIFHFTFHRTKLFPNECAFLSFYVHSVSLALHRRHWKVVWYSITRKRHIEGKIFHPFRALLFVSLRILLRNISYSQKHVELKIQQRFFFIQNYRFLSLL